MIKTAATRFCHGLNMYMCLYITLRYLCYFFEAVNLDMFIFASNMLSTIKVRVLMQGLVDTTPPTVVCHIIKNNSYAGVVVVMV